MGRDRLIQLGFLASLFAAGANALIPAQAWAGQAARTSPDAAVTPSADQIVGLADSQGHIVYVNTSVPRAAIPARRVSPAQKAHAPALNPALKSPAAPVASKALAPAPTTAEGIRPMPPAIDDLVHRTASQYQVDPGLVHAIIQVESENNPRAVSPKGAMGLMQLVPATAARFGVADPFDPQENVNGGVNYLRYLLDAFGGDVQLALAAYNAGEHAVWRFGGVPPFTETRQYVQKVGELYSSGFWDPPRQSGSADAAPIVRYVDAMGVLHFTN